MTNSIIRILFIIITIYISQNAFSQEFQYSDKFNLINLEKGKDYASNMLIIKVREQHKEIFFNKNTPTYTLISKNVSTIEKMFPEKQALKKTKNIYGQQLVDLSLIYTIHFEENKNIASLIDKLYSLEYFEYVEPYFIPQLLYTPNDPHINNQYYLTNIRAYDAWDITKGDTNIVIGIVDTGTELNHPDLTNNIKYNYEDPVNGFDTDNDGYVDNFYGWDLGENNNNPQYNKWAHGVHVSGIASASADNGVGIAGVGYYSKFLPVKIDNEYGLLTKGYQGIVYAADKGCRIINCSWGGTAGAGQFGQDIVNYATYNKNALVIAAAGNSNTTNLFYPASYENVLSVAATNIDDEKWSGSTYNLRVDISAPGDGIYSTWVNGTYVSSGGTSMAAPIVSGGAALIAAHFPSYLPIQIAAQLKASADNIDTIPGNIAYQGMLGKGRLNLYRALTETHHPHVRMISRNYSAEEFGTFTTGDTVEISGKFVNYLASTTNLSCTLKSLSPHITVIDSVVMFSGTINTLDTINNFSYPFKIVINQGMPLSKKIDFELGFNDNNYTDNQNFFEVFNIDFITLDTNKIKTTLTSKSRIGFNDHYKTQGLGFIYNNSGPSLLSFGGLIMGSSPTHVVDNIYGSIENSYNNDFFGISSIKEFAAPNNADFFAQAIFNDSLSGSKKMNIRIINNYYAWTAPPNDKYFISEYHIINEGSNTLSNFYAGLFMDWAISDNKYHRADYDANNEMGYAFSSQGDNFTALKLLTSGNSRFYAFDNLSGIDFTDGFTNIEKYNALRTNRLQAGMTDANNNVAGLLSSGPHTINIGDTLTVAFAIIAGDHLNDITNSAIAAQTQYNNDNQSANNIHLKSNNLFVYPNPTSDNFFIHFENDIAQTVSYEIFDVLGQKVFSKEIFCHKGTQIIEVQTPNIKKGMYFVNLKGNNFLKTSKIIYR